MPYRHAGIALCDVCSDFTVGTTCLRCGLPLCADHVPAVHVRCRDCEAEFEQLAAVSVSEPFGVLALRVLLVVATSVLLILAGQLDLSCRFGPYLSLAGSAMVLTFIISLGLIYYRRRSLRARFLEEQLPP